MKKIEYCSFYYLRQWLRSEKQLHTALNSNAEDIIHNGLSDAVKFFIVARNLPRKHDIGRGLPRYKPLLDAFLTVNQMDVTVGNYQDILLRFQRELSIGYGGKKLISLCSKLLWLRYQDPYIIYDSRVRSSLSVRPGDYGAYVREWLASYREIQSAIVEACSRIPISTRYIDFELSEEDIEGIDSTVSQAWFHKRVFDMCLWHMAAQLP